MPWPALTEAREESTTTAKRKLTFVHRPCTVPPLRLIFPLFANLTLVFAAARPNGKRVDVGGETAGVLPRASATTSIAAKIARFAAAAGPALDEREATGSSSPASAVPGGRRAARRLT